MCKSGLCNLTAKYVFLSQNNPNKLNPSCKMGLDFGIVFKGK